MRYQKAWGDRPIGQSTTVSVVKSIALRASMASLESDEWPIAPTPIDLERPILCDLMNAAFGRINPLAEMEFKRTEALLAQTGKEWKSHFSCDPTFIVHLIYAAGPVLFPSDPDFNRTRPRSRL